MDMPLQPRHRALRKGRVGLRGQLYQVTTVTHDRQPVFHRFEAATSACRAIHAHTREGELEATDVTSRLWLDIDTVEDLRNAEALVASGRIP